MSGPELRALRLSLGLTRAQAAMLLCVEGVAVVSMWERQWPEGDPRSPSGRGSKEIAVTMPDRRIVAMIDGEFAA